MSAAITTEGLTKQYRGGITALDGLDLEVKTGEAFGFIGPNGAGKTTAIRLLMGMLRPTSGRGQVMGFDCRSEGIDVRRRVGYLPGDLRLDQRLTARQSLTWFARLRGERDMARAWELAERFDLPLDRPARELSKGNRQKVGLVQAFQHRPPVVILDEPTSGLDPILQQRFQELVVEMRDEGGTLFISSHVLSELEQTADRVAMLREGRLLAVENVERLRAAAPHRMTIRFAAPVPDDLFDGIEGVSAVEVDGSLVQLLARAPMDAAVKAAARYEIVDLHSAEPDLEELFLGMYGDAGGRAEAEGDGA